MVRVLYYWFNDSEAMFPPKGKQRDDYKKVNRTHSETRPFKCKNHDNKIIAGERTFACAKLIKTYASLAQNGFISGRNFLCNVVGINAFARFASFPCNLHMLSVIVLFDLKAAFPCVSHQWLLLVSQTCKAPPKLLNFLKALYSSVRFFVSVDGN